jgi:hypothetical protein
VRLPRRVDGLALMRAAHERSVGVYPLGYAYAEPKPIHDELVLGYASLSEASIEEGVARLALALAECPPPAGSAQAARAGRAGHATLVGRSPTKEDGAIAR